MLVTHKMKYKCISYILATLIYIFTLTLVNYSSFRIFKYYRELQPYDIVLLYLTYFPFLIIISIISVILFLIAGATGKNLAIRSFIVTNIVSLSLGLYQACDMARYIGSELTYGESNIFEFINDSVALFSIYTLVIALTIICSILSFKGINYLGIIFQKSISK